MRRKHLFTKRVKAIEMGYTRSVSELLTQMKQTGYQGRKLAEALDVFEEMIKDNSVTILMGYAGSLSTAGQWRIINWLIENRFIDILVSTGANICEDIVEAMGLSYWQGSHLVDDQILFREGVNRYYDVYGKEEDYLKMTELIAQFIQTLNENYSYSSREFFYLFGKWLKKKKIESIVTVAAEHKVPIFCPAIMDSPYGDATLIAKSRGFNLTIDAAKDYVEFMRLSENVKDTAVVYIGGGVPKDFRLGQN